MAKLKRKTAARIIEKFQFLKAKLDESEKDRGSLAAELHAFDDRLQAAYVKEHEAARAVAELVSLRMTAAEGLSAAKERQAEIAKEIEAMATSVERAAARLAPRPDQDDDGDDDDQSVEINVSPIKLDPRKCVGNP